MLLHATLSNALELDPLAIELMRGHTVLAIDRRSAGQSVMPADDILGPIDARVHIDDMLAVLDTLAPGERVHVVGHSYGGCVGLEFAARYPERTSGAFLFEPPYLAVLPDTTASSLEFGARITSIARRDGLGAAALAFLETVNGAGMSRRLPPTVLAHLELEGRSAAADAALVGFDPAGLGRIGVQVDVGLGGRSRGPYQAVASALRERIPSLRTHAFPTLGHGGPISRSTTVAPVVADACRSERPPRIARSRTRRPRVTGNPVEPDRIRDMFDTISDVYDPMNTFISGFQEPRWRHRAVRAAALAPGMRALDIATGTGKVALEMWQQVQPGGDVEGIDFAEGMLAVARKRYADRAGLAFTTGDALALPVPDGTFDAATIAFGMRNLADYRRGFSEMARAVKPGGRVVCLEIARPQSPFARAAQAWFDRIVPIIGRLVGQRAAYSYLVSSTQEYPDPARIAAIMREVGLAEVSWQPMTLGIVTLHVGRKPA